MIDAEKAAANLVKFITMEQKHKQDWLDHKKAKFDAKMAMMKKHIDEWFNLKKKYAEQLAKGVKPEKYLADQLDEMITIHEKQKSEMQELCDSHHKKGTDLIQSHKTELDNFKKTLKS